MSAPWISIFLAAAGLFFVLLGCVALFKLRTKKRHALAEVAADDESFADSPVLREPQDEAPSAPAAPDTPRQAPQTSQAFDETLFAKGLAKSQATLWGRMAAVLGARKNLDDAVLEELETILLTSDVGVHMTERLLTALRDLRPQDSERLEDAARALIRENMRASLAPCDGLADPFVIAKDEERPKIILVVGVNGVGKTTTIGKLSHHLQARGHKVCLAAGDTFRAAAAEQLGVWAERTHARFVRGAEGADPASVMFNAVSAAQAHHDDVVLADTAGRLHNKTELMAEIKKVRRAMGKLRVGAPDETWLVVDATTGQNALNQAQQFHDALGLTGIVLTKLDGTAKGGVALGIVDRLKIPVRLIGLGEDASALQPFVSEAFVKALV